LLSQAKLKSLHEVVVRNRLEQLRKRQRDEAVHAQVELLAGVATKTEQSRNWGGDMRAEVPADAERDPGPPVTDDVEEYHRSMSPTLLDITKLLYEDREIDIISAEEDRQTLVRSSLLLVHLIQTDFSKFALRRNVAASRFVTKATQQTEVVQDIEAPSGADLDAEALYRAEAEKNMDEEEELFNLEENIVNPTTYTWEDKYRPRKPRYFNRVHTGYEWNKYNQTHYE